MSCHVMCYNETLSTLSHYRYELCITDRAARLRLAKEDLVTLESFSAGKVDVGVPLRYRARYQRLLRGMHVCLLCPQ